MSASGIHQHIMTQLRELQMRYDALTKRIAALDTDIGRELDSERKLVLQERQADLLAEREQVMANVEHIELQLASSSMVDLLNTQQVAARLQTEGLDFTVEQVATLASEGKLPHATKFGSGRWLFPRADIDNFIKRRRTWKKATSVARVGLVALLVALAFAAIISTKDALVWFKPLLQRPTTIPNHSSLPFPAVAQITNNPWNNFIPSFSPDNQHIVFLSDRDGNIEIYSMRTDGSQAQRLTETPATTEDVPSYSPDGRQIVFSGNDGNNEDLYLMNTDCTERINLTNTPNVNEGRPRISPSGQFVTFDSDRNGNWEIYIARLQRSGLSDTRQVTNRPDFMNRFPAFSPLGDLIIFRAELVDKGGESSRIYRMRMDGGELERILELPYMYYPAISPDGQWVAFATVKGGSTDLYLKALHKSALYQLTDHPADDYYPAFSPDGEWIVFASRRSGTNWNLFRMRLSSTTY
jgi:TolB protein